MKKTQFITINGETCLLQFLFDSMETTQVYISVKKRVGQSVLWNIADERCFLSNDYKNYSTLHFTAKNKEFDCCEWNLYFYIQQNVSFTKCVNFWSDRVSYELLRALA